MPAEVTDADADMVSEPEDRYRVKAFLLSDDDQRKEFEQTVSDNFVVKRTDIVENNDLLVWLEWWEKIEKEKEP